MLNESTIVSPEQGLEYGFLFAAQNGDVHKLKDFLEKGSSVNTQDKVSHINRVLFQHISLSDMACSLTPIIHCTFS